MTDGVDRALAAHHRFDRTADAFVPTATTFDARVYVEDGVIVENEVPMLDAVVENETVAAVVEDGWFETFERRVEDIGGVTKATEVEVVSIDRDGDSIVVETRLQATPGTVADDALAIVNYIEGTWVEGIIPGYDYVESIQSIRDRARQNAQDAPTG